MGIPWRATVSARSLEQGGIEVKRRDEDGQTVMPVEQLLGQLIA